MKRKLPIEILEELTSSQNDDKKTQNALLERCLNVSRPVLEEFLKDLSQRLCYYLPTLQIFISHIRDEPLPSIPYQVTLLPNFISMLINFVIMKNLHHADIPGFRKLLNNCVELLWQVSTGDKGNNQTRLVLQTTKYLFTAILDMEGVLGVLISGAAGHHFFKHILFDFNMINEIDREDLLRAIEIVGTLVEKCFDYKEVSPNLSEEFSIYKACNALLETLSAERTQNFRKDFLPPDLQEMIKLDEKNRAQRWNPVMISLSMIPLSTQDEKHLNILGMEFPQKSSDLPKFLRSLEQRKIDSFKDLIGFLPCANCHKRALVYFSPEKYSTLMEEEGVESEYNSSESIFRLPFEFNDTDKLGPWDVLLSEDAIEDMRKLWKSKPFAVEAVMKKLVQLSSGAWSKHGLQFKVSSHTIPVYEVVIPRFDGLRILWQVDCGFSTRSYSHIQLVKVWAITSIQKKIDNALEILAIIHSVYTAEHKYQCAIQGNGENGTIYPKFFGNEEETKSTDENLYDPEMDNEKLLEVHKMLVTNKFVPLSKNLFKLLVLDVSKKGVATFQVSKIEYEIINSPTSAIVIGRSGTGKTTCIVFRLLASYLTNQLCKTPSSYNNNSNGNFYKRQIFITVSDYLRWRVENHFKNLQNSAVLTENKMSEAEFNEYARKKMEESDSSEMTDDNIMREEDDEKKDMGSIPNSFRLLKDHHFPLFITYEKFSEMLQGTYGIDVRKSITKHKLDADYDTYDDEEEESRLRTYEKKSKPSIINYISFKSKYWRHFDDYYTKKLDCELVYSEFSVIKGTNPEVDCLTREEYRAISPKKYPIFCNNRDEIYDLFEHYENMKDDYDSVDRTLAILRAAKTKTLGGPHIHEIYIDECQDNQIMDINLILKLFDQTDSIFMAGDIAQCISPGSSFRFQDLSALMYKWECNRAITNCTQHNTAKPNQFELNKNYRSHNGILQLASSVIDLLWHFFPDSIDKLPPEHSEVYGPQPLIFKGFNAETFLLDAFSRGEQVGNFIEFGANQVIIVRDEDAKKNARYDSNGNIRFSGLVLTVFEAKGMEFNDVLLYNFFNDSPAGLKWRLVLSALDNYSKGIQTFSHERHYILSSELKHLYVALTRAREHLWIFDEDSESNEPIRTYWSNLKLIKVVRNVKEIGNSVLAKRSSPSEWNKEGKKYFEQRKYEQARTCFEKSGNKESYKLADAYYCQQTAREASINGSDEKTVKTKFLSAARAFEECSRPVRAASCYEEIGLYKKAGRCYTEGKMYDAAIIAYKNGRCYRNVISLMEKHGEEIDKKNSRRISRLVNIHYCRENDKTMSEKALSILPTEEDRMELLRDHAPEKLLEFCEERRQFRDAAKDLQNRGKFEEAAYMFIRSVDNEGEVDEEEDIIESLECFLRLCRVNVLINTMTDIKSLNILKELIDKANEIIIKIKKSQSSKKLSENLLKYGLWNNLIMEFNLCIAYLNQDFNKVHEYIQFFRNREEVVIEFYAINIWLKILQQEKFSIQVEYWHEWLQCLLRLCELAFSFISSHQRTFNLEKIYDNFERIFLVKKVEDREQKRKISFDNPLIDKIHGKIEDAAETDYWHVYDVDIIYKAISQFLTSYIFKLISKTDQDGRNIPDISSPICFKYSQCTKSDCRFHHVKPTPSVLHQRLTLACLQYTVMEQLNVLYSRRLLKEEQSKDVRRLQRLWAENLIRVHIRYQSPQTSCPEVTYMMLAKLPKFAYNGLINLAHKIWLKNLIEDPGNFAIMLKCMFVFQQLWNEWGINRFYWEMSKIEELSHPDDLLLGYDYYYGYHYAIPVGKRLSLFFSFLRSNRVIKAIYHIKKFIQYTISKNDLVCVDEPDAFSDLVTLMEFKASLVFAVGPEYCDFCLPQSYLINYFDAFTAEPLIPSQNVYKRDNYWAEVKNSLDQIRQLLDLLIDNERYYSAVILRLIRLLVLIGRNEYSLAQNVFNLFKYLNYKISAPNIKKYVEKNHMRALMEILKNDLKETGCDSLIIVYYQCDEVSKFTELERSGVTMLKYSSIEGFHSALQRIKSQVVIEESTSENQLLSQQTNSSRRNNDQIHDAFVVGDNNEEEDDEIAEEASVLTTEIQNWFRQIQDSPQAQEAAERIQTWFYRVQDREKSRQTRYNPTLDKVYTDVRVFCQNVTRDKGNQAVNKYHMLLRGPMVDIFVDLIELQSKMDEIKNKLQKKINDLSTDEEKLEKCLDLEDDLKTTHDDNVKLALDSLSITENKEKHEEANLEWLEIELQKAKKIHKEVGKWIRKCKALKL